MGGGQGWRGSGYTAIINICFQGHVCHDRAVLPSLFSILEFGGNILFSYRLMRFSDIYWYFSI